MGSVQAKSVSATPSPPSPSFDLTTLKARVEHVHVEGLNRTKDDYVASHVRPLLKADTFEDVVVGVQQVREELQSLGCFSSVEALIDVSPSGSTYYDVTFQVKEVGRIKGNIHTMVGSQEGKLVSGLAMPNAFGRGEVVDLNYVYGTTKNNTFNLSLLKPFGKSRRGTTSLFKEVVDVPACGYRSVNHGFLLDWAFQTLQLQHNLQYEACWRQQKALNLTTSFATRAGSGHTLKSALKHVMAHDTRDDLVFPSKGIFVQFKQELAGLGGDVGFKRFEAQVQLNKSLKDLLVLQTAVNCGLVLPSADPKKKITVTKI